MSTDRRSNRTGGGPPYCSNCGTGLEPSANFCPNCGLSNGRLTDRSSAESSTVRERTGPRASASTDSSGSVTDREHLEHRIATALQDGWELEHDFGDHAVMVKRSFGSRDEHLVVALITVWFTMGIGNALYGAYRYVGDAERMVLRTDHVENSDADRESTGSALRWRVTAAVCWLAAAIVAVVGLQVVTAAASYPLFLLAFVFAAMGVSALPSVQRRLESRHSVTANGRVRSVDERTVVAYDRPCAACADPVGRGLERIYRKEFCLLGVPLAASEGRNYYCKQCANGTRPTTPDRSGPPSSASNAKTDRLLETDPETERESV
ncbi:zinc ribbon domain-containing protein [Natronorubrum texcoconense]|uniref:Zinc-ribbon domain-containing protein n=1 Tax=Natronorubrum texcoconense TaxID=1095776 RepID=A0A1G8VEP7_9EURY|nr:zinc ribbon domain-containing protein [Natronorubrum texcoconense]SDJ64561.1 zinc-ribbon domain-containing protein [Natronorubrum texcoconense]